MCSKRLTPIPTRDNHDISSTEPQSRARCETVDLRDQEIGKRQAQCIGGWLYRVAMAVASSSTSSLSSDSTASALNLRVLDVSDNDIDGHKGMDANSLGLGSEHCPLEELFIHTNRHDK